MTNIYKYRWLKDIIQPLAYNLWTYGILQVEKLYLWKR